MVTPEFEKYTTNHNGYARVRREFSQPGDAAVLAQFEDAEPATPAGFRDLIQLNENIYAGQVVLEVIAEVASSETGLTTERLLRLTADTTPLKDVPSGARGSYFFRGSSFAWVSIDDGPLLTGSDSQGLVNMVIDFDTGTADIDLRTGVVGLSEVRTEMVAKDLPFNVRSGAFGGEVLIRVWDPNGPEIVNVPGSLAGSVGGTPTYTEGRHGLVTSGLFEGSTDDPRKVTVEGAFAGVDPNVGP